MTPCDYHVLCVDDDQDFLKSLELFLPEQIGPSAPAGIRYRPLFFSDPHEALQAVREMKEAGARVALVLSDQKMPRMKGTELLIEVRNVFPDSIRVLLTGYAGLESAIVAINNQLLDKYLTKPIENEHDFAVSLRHLLQRYHMQQTIADQTRTIRELYEFSNRLNAMQSYGETAACIAAFTCEVLCCRSAVVVRGEGEGLEVVGAWGLPPETVGSRGTRGEGWPPAGTTGAARAASCAELPHAGRLPPSVLQGQDGGPLAYVPLTCGGRCLGLIQAGGKLGQPDFHQGDLETLAYLGSTASIAISNQLDRLGLQIAAREAREARDRLQVLDRMKTDFLAFISHELRTPLTAMSAVDMLGRLPDPQAQEELVKSMQGGYARLRDFVIRGLTYFSWTAEKRDLSAQSVDFVQLVRQVLGDMPRLAAAGPVISLPDECCEVHGDAESLSEVVGILLDNSLKFSGEEKAIQVEVAVDREAVRLCVADRGCGFPPEFAREIFRPFTVTDTVHHSSGSALNLALAAAIVEAHGGRIWAESAGAGRGATFTVELPRSIVSALAVREPEPALTV